MRISRGVHHSPLCSSPPFAPQRGGEPSLHAHSRRLQRTVLRAVRCLWLNGFGLGCAYQAYPVPGAERGRVYDRDPRHLAGAGSTPRPLLQLTRQVPGALPGVVRDELTRHSLSISCPGHQPVSVRNIGGRSVIPNLLNLPGRPGRNTRIAAQEIAVRPAGPPVPRGSSRSVRCRCRSVRA